MRDADTTEQHSLPVSIALHLVPGLVILLFYLMIAPIFVGLGFPASFAIMLSFVCVGIPLQLGILYYQGFKRNDALSLKGVVLYREKIPFWHYPVIVIGLIFYAIVIASMYSPVSAYLKGSVFSSLPAWFLNSSSGQVAGSALLMVLVVRLLVDGLANPIVEELYFRGYLLPRISRFKAFAPLLNASLFALAHYWQPANILQIFLIVLPLYYLVWWKRSIFISIAVHCAANLLGAIATAGSALG